MRGVVVEKFYTPHEVAEVMRVSYMTVLRYIDAGRINAVWFGGYRIPQDELDRIMEEGVR